MRVKIITCYYGELPSWFDLWLLSCRYNPKFDFMVVTDVATDYFEIPANVLVKKISIVQLKERFSSSVGFEVCLEKPYKICDFKPLFGLAFKDELEGYDFWGHCDLDMIFGCIDNFISYSILNQYDVIGSRGHLILYRNNERINSLYKLKGSLFSYKTVFKNPESYNFDEMGGMNRIVRKNKIKLYDYLKFGNCNTNYKRLIVKGTIVGPDIICWKEGHIYRVSFIEKLIKEEFVYMHFSGKYPLNLASKSTNSFYIRSDVFRDREVVEFSKSEVLENTEFISLKDDSIQKKVRVKEKLKKLYSLSCRQKFINIYLNFHIKLGL